MRPPSLPTLLRANAEVIWAWVAVSAITWAIQLGIGRTQPSQGLALSSAALPAALVAASSPRIRRWCMLAVVAASALLASVNAMYHQMIGDFLPVRAFLAPGQGWAMRGYAAGLLAAGHSVPALLVVATAATALLRRRPGPQVSRRWHTALPLAICLLGSAPALGWAWRVSPGAADTQTGGFLYAHVVDVRRIVGEWTMAADPAPEDMERVLRFTERPRAADGADPWFGRAAGSSVLLVQVEALNAWLLVAEVEGEPVVPFLRSLAARGLAFDDVFDDTHQGRSSDSDYLAMVSQHPLERDAISMTRPNLDVVALPDVLKEHGYVTLSAHAHTPGFWNSAVRHERYGFETSLFEADLGPGESLGFGLVDRVFFQRVVPHLSALPRPWLAWLITLTMHGPHGPVPPSFRTLQLGPLEGSPLGNFLLKARHTDDALRELLDSLDARGALDGTMVVVYGDHTESYQFDMSWVERAAGVEGLDPEARRVLLDRVPLIVVPPGDGPGGRFDAVGGLLDVAPTVLHLLGVEAPRSFLGRSLTLPGPSVAAQASGEVVGDGLMWTGTSCRAFPAGTARPGRDCDDLRARAREELEVSWLVTRYGLGPRLGGRSGPS